MDYKSVQNRFFAFRLSIAVTLGIGSILALTLIPRPPRISAIPGVTVTFRYQAPDRRLSAREIQREDSPWRNLPEDALTVHSQCAYVAVSISNSTAEDRSFIVSNHTRNYLTALLVPSDRGAVQRYRQGDPVPSSESPLRHFRPAFPVQVAAGQTSVFYLEYLNERGIVLDPAVNDSADWFTHAAQERDIATLVAGLLVSVLLLNLLGGLLLERGALLRLAFLVFSLTFFFLRQSRLLLQLVDPLPYAEWLYPLSIGLELVSAHLYFGFLMGPNFRWWQHTAYRALSAATVGIVGISFFFQTYTMADVLNVLALITLFIVLIGVFRALRNRDVPVLLTMLALGPWIGLMAAEVVIIYIVPRQVFLADYRQAFGMVLSLILATITEFRAAEHALSEDREETLRQRDEARRSAERCITSTGERVRLARSSMAAEAYPGLEGIAAAAAALAREHTDPGVVAASRLIIGETETLQRHLRRKAEAE